MTIWAIADLHLSFGVPNKSMDIFGERWQRHAERVQANWEAKISADDLILIAGDISWAKRSEDAIPDLEWIHALPGTKVMIRGNHDYWWESMKKLKEILPDSIHAIHNTAFDWHDVSVAGGRLWDTKEYSFDGNVAYLPSAATSAPLESPQPLDDEHIYDRELVRLETSLKLMNPKARLRLTMTHYPPIGPELIPTRAAKLLSRYKIDTCVFGHVHNVVPDSLPFGTCEGVRYVMTACDYINCDPVKLYD